MVPWMGFGKRIMTNLEGIDEPLFLFDVDPWMLLRVVEDEKVPEDSLSEHYPRVLHMN